MVAKWQLIILKNSENKMKNKCITPGYISGLTQTDGSFFCSISLSSKHLFGIQFRPKFTITADLDSKYVLDSVQSYFQQSGKININIMIENFLLKCTS